MKKSICFVMVLALCTGSLLWAGGKTEAAAGKMEPVTLQYLTRLRAEEFGREVLNAMAAEYEAQNPGIKIEYLDVSYDDLRSQTLLKAQAGTPPNITEPVLSWIPQLAGAGILEPITNFLSKDDLAKYIQSPIEDSKVGGVPYAVPFWHGPIVLYANKNLMGKAGYAVKDPTDIYQWKEMIQKIGSLGKDSKGQNIVGFSMRNNKVANSGFWFTPWIWTWGGELVDSANKPALDSKGMRDALAFYQWCTDKGYSAKGIDAVGSRVMFAEGRAGFVYDGPWLKGMFPGMTDNKNIDDTYEVLLMPKGVKGENWTIANPTSLVVLKGSKNKDKAFDYIKFLTASDQVSKLLAEKMGLLPTFKKFADSDPSMQTPFAKTFFKQMPFSRGVPWKDEKWPGLQDILATAMSDAISGGDVNQTAVSAQKAFMDLVSN